MEKKITKSGAMKAALPPPKAGASPEAALQNEEADMAKSAGEHLSQHGFGYGSKMVQNVQSFSALRAINTVSAKLLCRHEIELCSSLLAKIAEGGVAYFEKFSLPYSIYRVEIFNENIEVCITLVIHLFH
uniref:Uncharacterized protein n=1 Tax=Romanomermis culicivorax TaxID=13658 RepID=A0A915HHN2_ROMCU